MRYIVCVTVVFAVAVLSLLTSTVVADCAKQGCREAYEIWIDNGSGKVRFYSIYWYDGKGYYWKQCLSGVWTENAVSGTCVDLFFEFSGKSQPVNGYYVDPPCTRQCTSANTPQVCFDWVTDSVFGSYQTVVKNCAY